MPKKIDANDIEPVAQQGEVIEKLPEAQYQVRIADGTVLKCYLHWRVRGIPSKEIMPKVGSLVLVEVHPCDSSRGRIDLQLMAQVYQAEKRRQYQKKYRMRKLQSKNVKKED